VPAGVRGGVHAGVHAGIAPVCVLNTGPGRMRVVARRIRQTSLCAPHVHHELVLDAHYLAVTRRGGSS